MKDDVEITDLVIPGKKGPFRVRVLDFDEAFDALYSGKNANTETPLTLKMAQLCLVNGDGKAVYPPTPAGLAKMKKEIRPAAKLMVVAMTAYKINGIAELLELATETDDAVKN